MPVGHRAGVQLVLSGHDGVEYAITGARAAREADNVSWAAEGHFLIVDVEPERPVVHPVTDIGEDGRFTYLRRTGGAPVDGPIVIGRR